MYINTVPVWQSRVNKFPSVQKKYKVCPSLVSLCLWNQTVMESVKTKSNSLHCSMQLLQSSSQVASKRFKHDKKSNNIKQSALRCSTSTIQKLSVTEMIQTRQEIEPVKDTIGRRKSICLSLRQLIQPP